MPAFYFTALIYKYSGILCFPFYVQSHHNSMLFPPARAVYKPVLPGRVHVYSTLPPVGAAGTLVNAGEQSSCGPAGYGCRWV